MNNDYYTDQSAISKSGLDKIETSPLDYWWHYLRPDRDPYEADKKTIFDDALRCAVLTPKEFANNYVKQPSINKATNIGKSEFAALVKSVQDSGQILISAADYDNIRAMADALHQHPAGKILFGSGTVGTPLRFQEWNTEAIVKFRPHWISTEGNFIVNLMSTKDAGAENFAKETWNFKNHKKAALQLDGFSALNEAKSNFLFVNIEQEAPYKIGVRFLDDRSLQLGRATYIANCEKYMECLESGKWPGLDERVNPLSLPTWAFPKSWQE